MNHPEVVDRLAILNAAHPRKLSQGLHHPGQLRKSWYFFFFDLPELPEAVVHADRWHFFRQFLHDARPAYQERRGRILSRPISGNWPVRAQAAAAPGTGGTPVAAEPLRCLPL